MIDRAIRTITTASAARSAPTTIRNRQVPDRRLAGSVATIGGRT
jgi:hypothetical protein